jgi:GTPase SAR1 family protein
MMAISGYDDRSQFGEKLNTVVSPAQPIHSIEHLFGRENELDRIEKALYAPGRHIFIYGDRGVGKSSLAATAANQYQSSDSEYIDIPCASDSTLRSIASAIAYQATKTSRIHSVERSYKRLFDLRYFQHENSEVKTIRNLSDEIQNLTDAVELLREVSQLHSERPIVVLDEFDQIKSQDERNLFSSLVKNIGDKRIPIKFIFTGVAKTLEELLGAHPSAIRQFETIELSKLSWEGRWEILLRAAEKFGINVDRNIYMRVAMVSDGYPFYAHLITEKMLWRIFDDTDVITEAKREHYNEAIRDSIESISAELKRPYETAINQRSDDYEEVLWSTADSEILQRFLEDMYSSYQYIMKQIRNKQPLGYEKYAARIRNLKNESFGQILISENRRGLYSYKEKILRGYVRMQAEAHGIELIGDEAKPTDKQHMHMPARTSVGYRQSTIPKGIQFGRKRDK